MNWTVDRRDLLKTLVGGAGLMAGMNPLAGAKELAEAKEKVRRAGRR
ncbi:MAG: hypothetical protein NTZ17_00640 [Phycisphaerae bacterium]|nr:hypothetical protein [Phycisphaerae bacterium]